MSLTRKITKNEQNKLLQLQNSTRKSSLNKFIKSLERKHVNLQYLRPRQNGPLAQLAERRARRARQIGPRAAAEEAAAAKDHGVAQQLSAELVRTPKVVTLPMLIEQRAYIEDMRGKPKSTKMCKWHCAGAKCWAYDDLDPKDKTCPFVHRGDPTWKPCSSQTRGRASQPRGTTGKSGTRSKSGTRLPTVVKR